MIKKMTKYSFVVFHKEVEDFLKNLQEIGVVDITRQKRAIDSYSMEQFEEIARIKSAVSAHNTSDDAHNERCRHTVGWWNLRCVNDTHATTCARTHIEESATLFHTLGSAYNELFDCWNNPVSYTHLTLPTN